MHWSLRIIWMMAFIVVGSYLKTIVVNNPMDVMYGVGALMGVFLGLLTMYEAQERKGK